MKFFQHAMGAFVLACLSGAASATTVQVDFTIYVPSKVITTLNQGVSTSVPDTTFQPVTFDASFSFDLDNPSSTSVYQPGDDVARSWIHFERPTSTFTPTPFTASLQVPAPPRSATQGSTEARYGEYQFGVFHDPAEALTVIKQANFNAQNIWFADGLDGAGTSTVQIYARDIIFEAYGSPLSSSELDELSGADVLAFFQTQVGMLHPGAFSEIGWRFVRAQSNPSELISNDSIEYKGDVFIRSVSVVPETGTLWLSLLGLAAITARVSRARR